MSMNLAMPGQVAKTTPGQPFKSEEFVFHHVPGIRELLPQFRGLPGFEYLQCCVENLRRAQDEGWREVENTVIYTIEGELGRVDMKLLARGKRIPGQPHDSGARLCICDKTVEEKTGVRINPHLHEAKTDDPETPVFTGGDSDGAKSKSG
jgi:hypothetical protein